jgi:hypothetical protein
MQLPFLLRITRVHLTNLLKKHEISNFLPVYFLTLLLNYLTNTMRFSLFTAILFFCLLYSPLLGVSQGFLSKLSGGSPDDDKAQTPHLAFHFPEIPDKLEFAGERVPMENFDIRESMEREMMVNAFWHSQAFFIIKHANRFFPMIEPILRKHKIPDDFKYLCVAESALQQAVSPAGAVGFWQILATTGRELGLEINNEVDERYHIEKSTEAACKFLQKSYDIFGSWSLAAASYNMGRAGLTKQITKQKSLSYYDLRLSEETTRYLFRILALKLIISNPSKYGFNLKEEDLYPPFRYKEVSVNTPIVSWADFAAQYGTNYKMLKILNPWLRESFLTNKNHKTYRIKIPEKGFREKAYKK